jgi:hypothetical protein
VNELARTVARMMGVECRLVHLEPRNEVKVAFSDDSKAERVFGARNKVPLEGGIRRMAEWAKADGPRTSTFFDDIEITRNLPLSWADAATQRSTRAPSRTAIEVAELRTHHLGQCVN